MRPAKYNWDVWLSPGITLLFRGRDYVCSQSSMIQQIRSMASARKVSATVRDQDYYIEILVKDVPPCTTSELTPESLEGSPSSTDSVESTVVYPCPIPLNESGK